MLRKYIVYRKQAMVLSLQTTSLSALFYSTVMMNTKKKAVLQSRAAFFMVVDAFSDLGICPQFCWERITISVR